MTDNRVFSEAQRNLEGIFASIEAEIERLKSLDAVAKGAQQRITALNASEEEIKGRLARWQDQITAAQRGKIEADNTASRIKADARTEAERIRADARTEAEKIKADAAKEAGANEVQAREKLAVVAADIVTTTAALASKRDELATVEKSLAEMRKHAAAAMAGV